MVDTEKLRKAVKHFEFTSSPSDGNSSNPCTIGDLKKVIRNTGDLFRTFIDEIESHEN